MKNKTTTLTTLALVVLMIFTSSCTRNAVEEPSPLGPSSFSTILSMSASPNVIFAGPNREMTTITTSLSRFDGIAIANKTVHFDIRDAFGTNITIGHFESNQATATKITDINGRISLDYYGPFAQELLADMTVYITAIVAWEGEEFISEFAPVYIFRDASDWSFTAIADPNILLASDTRSTSQIKAYFNTADGIPVAGRKVFFWVERVENIQATGYFEGNKTLTYALTDENGFASVIYYSPTKDEISGNGGVILMAQPETAGDTDFNYLQVEMYIRILKDL
jgi:hypothetical protein